MKANTTYISNVNSYANNEPLYIVVHNTDNEASTADARRHAMAQHNGNFKGYSAHHFVDDKEWYQAMPNDRGAYHVGVNYGGKLFGKVNNHNSIGVEMCMNAGYDYEKAFQNTVEVVKTLMQQYKIPSDRVVTHYDVCGKNCPSVIRAKKDWDRFKSLVNGTNVSHSAPEPQIKVDQLYRVRKTWLDGKSQIGAYTKLNNAKDKADKNPGYVVYDWNGNAVYYNRGYLEIGDYGEKVGKLQEMLNYCGYNCGAVDNDFGIKTERALESFQMDNNLNADKKYDDESKNALERLYAIIQAYNRRIS